MEEMKGIFGTSAEAVSLQSVLALQFTSSSSSMTVVPRALISMALIVTSLLQLTTIDTVSELPFLIG